MLPPLLYLTESAIFIASNLKQNLHREYTDQLIAAVLHNADRGARFAILNPALKSDALR
jgi:hypothetical protein